MPQVFDSTGKLKTIGSGGGVTDHTDLDSATLDFSSSGHTGTADTVAAFDGAGAAVEKAVTGTGSVVLDTSPTIVTPTIASFANAAHDHEDAAGGGQLSHALALTALGWPSSGHTGTASRVAAFDGAGAAAEIAMTGSGNVVLATAPTIAGATVTGVVDAGGADSFEIPNGTAPTVDAAGEIAIDTDADGDLIDQGLIVYHDGAQKMFVVAVDALPSTDDHALCYDATADKFVFQAQSGSGTTDHAALDAGSLVWTDSAHTGTADRAAVFDGGGAAALKAFTGTGDVVLATSPTIVTPTIASFANAAHDHEDAAGGGQLDHGLALTGLTDDDHTVYALLAGRATGQVLTGGTAADDDLTLRPTTNATKGDVIICDEGGNVIVGGGAAASELRIMEASGSGTNYTAFKAQAQAGNVTYTLPPDDGDAGEFLQTDGSGGLTWESAAAGSLDIDGLTAETNVETTDTVPLYDASATANRKATVDNLVKKAISTAKGWINMNGTGTIAVNDHYNVNSLVDNGTGDYTIVWADDFANATYCPVGMIVNAFGVQNGLIGFDTSSALAVGSTRVQCVQSSDGSAIDTALLTLVAFGDR